MSPEPSIFELITILAGFAAMAFSFACSMYFMQSNKGIIRAVAFDKLAESVGMAVILIFAISYWHNLFVKMPVWMACSLRMCAITATLFSTVHLSMQAYRIHRGRLNEDIDA